MDNYEIFYVAESIGVFLILMATLSIQAAHDYPHNREEYMETLMAYCPICIIFAGLWPAVLVVGAVVGILYFIIKMMGDSHYKEGG